MGEIDIGSARAAFDTASGYAEWATIIVALGVFIELMALFVFSQEMPPLEKAVMIFATLLIVAGCGGEYMFGSRANDAAAQLQQASDRQIARLKSDAESARSSLAEEERRTSEANASSAQANSRAAALEKESASTRASIATAEENTAKANEAAAMANQRAADLEKEAASARFRAAEIMKSAAWRQLPEDQIAILQTALTANPGKVIVGWVANDSEALYLAIQVSNILNKAHWQVTPSARTYPTQIILGVIVPDSTSEDTQRLRTALKTANIHFFTTNLPQETMAFSIANAPSDKDTATIVNIPRQSRGLYDVSRSKRLKTPLAWLLTSEAPAVASGNTRVFVTS